MSTQNLFLNNKYTKWYFQIIEKAKSQNRIKSKDVYYESHHVIPRCMNGTNKKDNLVLLTFREHFICHRLLSKMCVCDKNKNKMLFAIFAMAKLNKSTQKREITNYQKIISLESNRIASKNRNHKPHLGKYHKDETKKRMAEISSMRSHSDETKKRISESQIGKSKPGTSKGLRGKLKSETHKKNISMSLKGKKGIRKSRKSGTHIWITNGTDNKRIKISEIIPNGYKKGRIIKINK